MEGSDHIQIAGTLMIPLCLIIHMLCSNCSLVIATILRANNSHYPAAILLGLWRKQSYFFDGSVAHYNNLKNFLIKHHTRTSEGQQTGISLSLLIRREHMMVLVELHKPVCNDFIQKTLWIEGRIFWLDTL